MRIQLAASLVPPLLVLSAACTTIDEQRRVPGWPELRVVEHYVPYEVMRKRCSKYVSFGMVPEACSEFDLARGDCHIWYSADYPPARFVIRHERLHCQGYDHTGSTAMEQLLQRYRERQAAAEAAAGKRPSGS
jgi:hypothetical protein